jgi:hypothetical protein
MITWTSLPFRIGGKKNIVAIAVPVALWAIVLVLWGVWWFVISLILIGGSILPYYLPTTYVLSEKGISVRSLFTRQNRKWADYRSFYVDEHGVLLSPFNKPSRLENFRGVYLRFHKNGEEVVAFVKQKLGATDEG